MEIVLASGSPRRKRLLGKIVPRFSVVPPSVDERLKKGEPFPKACLRLAEEKARAVAEKRPGCTVIGADTIAYRGKKIFRKTEDKQIARKILLELSGKIHTVVTGVAVIFPTGNATAYAARASVRMKKLDGKLLENYLKSGEWRGRAGCYDISGKGRLLVEKVNGERETVVGLPLARLRLILKGKKDKKRQRLQLPL